MVGRGRLITSASSTFTLNLGYFHSIKGDTQDHVSQRDVSACQLLTRNQSPSSHTTDMLKMSTDFSTVVPTGTDPKHRTS